jgi:hypothetical protein
MPDKRTAALKAATSGMHVFPCEPDGKTPLVAQGRTLEWSKVATDNPEKVGWWWQHYPAANIGIACKPSGLLVVDCDIDKGHPLPESLQADGIHSGEDVYAHMTTLMEVDFPADTCTVRTPSGGAHYYYHNRGNVQLKNSPLVPGWIDIRANGGAHGGYVLAPGSTLETGNYEVITRAAIMDAPDWLITLCEPKKYEQASIPESEYRQPTNHAGLAMVVRHAQEGNRNNAIHWAACVMAKDGVPESEAILEITAAASSHIGNGMAEYEIERTVKSAYRTVHGQ